MVLQDKSESQDVLLQRDSPTKGGPGGQWGRKLLSNLAKFQVLCLFSNFVWKKETTIHLLGA